MSVTNDKDCYCETCKRWFHYLGISRHRAMHRDRREYCEIVYSNGETVAHRYDDAQQQDTKKEPDK